MYLHGFGDLSGEGSVIGVKRMGEVDEKPFLKEVVDDEDEKLKKLSEELGEDVMNAVKTALEELNDFNPSE
ncbi:hypothetical protein DY000_02016995 [Brassica cretica]|uniref:Factor of DNA methylation 1-5/IDN2 domain-containing protein n=1 Tax=Brassica cretica TaxID=69181 RepID=A0ABQ7D9L1_BRACR|nr:hypothetical protein DY000_02016995 [Brassica cretica]